MISPRADLGRMVDVRKALMGPRGRLSVPWGPVQPSTRKIRVLRYAPPLSGDCWPPQGFRRRSSGPSRFVIDQVRKRKGSDMRTIHTDVHVTRRKRQAMVTDDAGDVIFTGPTAYSAFQFMLDNGWYSFELRHEGVRMRCCIGRITD